MSGPYCIPGATAAKHREYARDEKLVVKLWNCTEEDKDRFQVTMWTLSKNRNYRVVSWRAVSTSALSRYLRPRMCEYHTRILYYCYLVSDARQQTGLDTTQAQISRKAKAVVASWIRYLSSQEKSQFCLSARKALPHDLSYVHPGHAVTLSEPLQLKVGAVPIATYSKRHEAICYR